MNDAEVPEAEAAAPVEASPATFQETDAWWGAYSGWTMLPSILVCVALTALIFGGVWFVVERRYVQWTIWTFVGSIWLVQMTRFCSRVFGVTYRLTTRRLMVMRGHFRRQRREIDLREIRDVAVKLRGIPFGINIGSIIVTGSAGQRLVLDGVRGPDQSADRIRKSVLRAREG